MVELVPSVPAVPLISPPEWGDSVQMFALSQNLVGVTEGYIQALVDKASSLTAPTIQPKFPVVSNPPLPVTAPTPTLINVTWSTPASIAPFTSTLNLGNLFPPAFASTAPNLIFPAAPATFGSTAPSSPAVNLNFTYPTVSVSLPGVPQLLSLDTVLFNAPTIPAFNVTVPTLNLNAPGIVPFLEPSSFSSQLLTDLISSIDGAITLGTFTGLPPSIETNLWNRAREREYRQMADALAELDRMETLGFAFPPGVFIDGRIKIQTEFGNTVAGLSRDIAIKQAELILENITKCREEAVQLESKLIDQANQVAQRAFESAKYATEASIALYNAQIKSYEASLEGYKTQAIVYDTQIKGILAQVEVLKANIEFEQVKANINTALVQQYKVEVDAALATVQIFELQVKIIETQANVEKIKVEVFGEQIKAFVGQINAYSAQVEAYKATVETQGVIENVYKTQVEAYAATVNAGVAEANALVAVYRGQIDAYTAQLGGYKAAIEGMVAQAHAAAEYNDAAANVYRALTAADSSYNDNLTKQWEAILNEQEKIAEVGVAAAKANGDLYIAARGLSLDASKVGAQVAAQLGSAALGAIHWANNSSWALSTAGSNSAANSAINEAINSQSASV